MPLALRWSADCCLYSPLRGAERSTKLLWRVSWGGLSYQRTCDRRPCGRQLSTKQGTGFSMAEGQSKAEYDQRWHDAWQQGVPQGRKWDVGHTAPALSQFLDSGFLSVEGKTAYVPGCGRGYDAIELAKRGAHATGLDLAPESVEEAQKYLQTQDSPSISGSIHFVSGDYFTYKTDTPWVDVGYDFTFMCALHPSLRNDWARTWNKVVKSGGYLIALEYPIRPDDKTGPPWPVSPQIYADLLMPLGFKNVYYKEVDQASLSHPRLPGAEVLACYQKL